MAVGPKSSHEAAQAEINSRLYQRADLVRTYANPILSPPEVTALVRYRDDIVARPVLDLGCGAGRLAAFLRPLTERYVGLDFSPHMVEFCRQRLDGLRFLQGDMRDLKRFGDGSFDAVFAICTLFDAVSHGERLQILADVHRILRPGGLLVFSCHNRNWKGLGAGPRLGFSRNPVTFLRCIQYYLEARVNRRRIKPHEHSDPDYAVMNDSAHNFAALHYCITRDAQGRQLAAAGFRVIEWLDEAGRTLQPGDDDSGCTSLHCIARTLVPRLVPDEPLPRYAFIPGQTPHPVSDPAGHSFGLVPSLPTKLDPDHWQTSKAYLYGIDLFNAGFYWESHEQWEGLWHASGRTGATADFVKGLIKLAAAGVKHLEGNPVGVKSHACRAAELLKATSGSLSDGNAIYLGYPVATLVALVGAICRDGWPPRPVILELATGVMN